MAMNPPVRDWRDQRVWVVGASTGIGEALARALLDRGSRVAVSARRADRLEALEAHAPARCIPLPLDVTDERAVEAAAASLSERWGGIDTVLVVAGSYRPMRAWDMTPSAVRSLFDVNVIGALSVVQRVLPGMLSAGRGRIVLVSSVAGYRALPKAFGYGATKAALTYLAESLYLDLAPRGLAVHVVHPGFVRTPLTDGNDFRMPALIDPEEAAARTLRGIERGDFEIHYPRRFTTWLKLLRVLPYRWYFPLVHRVTGL